MNRRSFRTKNILNRHSLVYITIMCFVLLAVFLILGNVGRIVRSANLDGGKGDPEVVNAALEEGTAELMNEKIITLPEDAPEVSESFAGGNGNLKVSLWGEDKLLDSLASQMMIMGQSYDRIESLENLEGVDVLVAASENIGEEELESIEGFVENGGSLWLACLTRSLALDESAAQLMGITGCGPLKTWPGIRFSGDISGGYVRENPEYKVSALDITLDNRVKLYASALPENYKEIDNEDLPPLIWRYVATENGGRVYVTNGDFMDTEVLYYMIPVIMSELQDNYMYGVVNACCVFVEGFPYAQNEERDSWMRLYSRDKMAIAQDLISSQYLRYYTSYGARISYFSGDYVQLINNEDINLRYYTDTIESSMALLALQDEKGLFLESSDEKLDIKDWEKGFSFTEGGNYCLPVNFEYTIENNEEQNFVMLSSAMGLGYYCFLNDVDKLLDYDGEADIWDEYCKNQEVVFGMCRQLCGWLERVTASQALERLANLLNSDTRITYGTDGSVNVKTDAEKAWFILRGKYKNIEIEGGSAEEIGERCWLIEVEGGSAFIRCR